MKSRPLVLIGLLGTTLDMGKRQDRWERWRPTVSLCQHEELLIDRLELLHQGRFERLGIDVSADISAVSPETEVRRHHIEFDDAWDFEEVYSALLDFARDYPFDTDREDYLLHITTGTHVAQICLFLLTESRYMPGKLIQSSPPTRKRGGSSVGNYRIIDLDLSRYDRIAQRFVAEQREGLSFLKSGIDTRNPSFNHMIEQIEQVAIRSREPILLTGPTGAGKSALARRIYDLKRQRRQLEGPFVEVNCATLRGDAAMSTLFGHRRGAFTGAVTDRQGLLLAADGGQLFLDEVGELGVDEQAMLLRAVEERRFLPVGADAEVQSEFQLICGTNRDLQQAVASGRFREDLLARINLWTFQLPGLHERAEDIEPNVRFELERHAARSKNNVRFNTEARRAFMDFATSHRGRWLGNFRDLNAAITRMATLATAGRINEAIVAQEIGRLEASWSGPADPGGDDELLERALGRDHAADLDHFDRVQLAEVVRVCRRSPSLSAAGRELFAVSRQRKKVPNDADRLRKYLARFGLAWADL